MDREARSVLGCSGNIPYVPSPSKLLLPDFKASAVGCKEGLGQCSASPLAAEDTDWLALAAGTGHGFLHPRTSVFFGLTVRNSFHVLNANPLKGFQDAK